MAVLQRVEGIMKDLSAGEGTVRTPRGRGPTLKVLLAEDNAVNRVATQFLLRHLGHLADVAVNGVEVLEALDREDYDVVLMDLQMPLMDGLEATRRLRDAGRCHQPRVIALTASDAGEDRDLCLAAGMQDFLRKPIRPAELTVALSRCEPSPA